MELKATLYDSKGKEMEIPEDCHVVCSAKGMFYVPFSEEEKKFKAKIVYQPERLNPEDLKE